MIRRASLLAALAALAVAAPAGADPASGGMNKMSAPAQPAKVLALQALALLEQGREHQQAEQKLDEALAADDRGGIDMRALRRAHQALHREAAAEASRLLEDAFPRGSTHVVGVTYRPQLATTRVVAGVGGAALGGAAAAGLLLRRRRERHVLTSRG